MSQTEVSRVQLADEVVEDLLVDLVSVESPSLQEQKASRFLADWMGAHGYDEAFVDESDSAVGIIGHGSRDIVLLGHVDTFGSNFPVRREGRLLYGRGSVDAKGPLATFAAAATQANLPPDVRLIVIGATEEESPASRGAHHAMTQYHPEICVIGEPSQWDRVTLGYKGKMLISWKWRGDLGHSAGQVATAAELAFAYWQHVLDYAAQVNEGRDRIFDQLDVACQQIQTGHDGIYGWGWMDIGFRLPPRLTLQEVADALQSDNDATVEVHGEINAFVGERDSVISRALRGAIRAEGGQPAFVHKTGTSDMNFVGPVWDCPIVAYGPGDSSLDHTPHEHTDLDEYLRAVRVLKNALERL
jgi:LysW-gamma-L-lysine carboxypeptidase